MLSHNVKKVRYSDYKIICKHLHQSWSHSDEQIFPQLSESVYKKYLKSFSYFHTAFSPYKIINVALFGFPNFCTTETEFPILFHYFGNIFGRVWALAV